MILILRRTLHYVHKSVGMSFLINTWVDCFMHAMLVENYISNHPRTTKPVLSVLQ